MLSCKTIATEDSIKSTMELKIQSFKSRRMSTWVNSEKETFKSTINECYKWKVVRGCYYIGCYLNIVLEYQSWTHPLILCTIINTHF